MNLTTTNRRPAMRRTQIGFSPWLIWVLFAIILVAAPLLFTTGSSLSILSQMGAMMIFALSYNMLLGQGAMLSFGHAVYSGLGAFFAIKAMNLASAGNLNIPLALIPLVGGFTGLIFGVLFGYVSTKKAGTTFAMITLGIVELVFASALIFTGFFGGEGGISANRVYGEPFLGITYGPQIEVYYLIAVWLFISTVAMFAFTQTPLGRLINAVRDNPERVEFIGYNPQRVRYLTLILSGFFAGISGALAAINFEIITAENVSLARSGAVLLFTFIGGIGYFFGPLLGAVIGVFFTAMLSDYTTAWQLYLGLFFMLIVMYAPGGLAKVLMDNFRVIKFGKWGKVWARMLAVIVAALVALTGGVILIELLYHMMLDSAASTSVRLLGVVMDATEPTAWVAAVVLVAFGGVSFRYARKPFVDVWNEANAEIEEEIRRTA